MGLSDSDLSGLGRQHFLTDSEMLRVYFVDLKPDLFSVNLQVTAAQSEPASVEVQFNRNRRLSLSLNCKLYIYFTLSSVSSSGRLLCSCSGRSGLKIISG